jgi:hypothetical protein
MAGRCNVSLVLHKSGKFERLGSYIWEFRDSHLPRHHAPSLCRLVAVDLIDRYAPWQRMAKVRRDGDSMFETAGNR